MASAEGYPHVAVLRGDQLQRAVGPVCGEKPRFHRDGLRFGFFGRPAFGVPSPALDLPRKVPAGLLEVLEGVAFVPRAGYVFDYVPEVESQPPCLDDVDGLESGAGAVVGGVVDVPHRILLHLSCPSGPILHSAMA